MFAAEVLDRYAAGERNFTTPVEFTHVDLSGVDLSGIRLSGSYFDYVNLTNANLSSASFQEARINGYNILTGANMTGIDLRYASIDGAYLSGVNLENADLSNASIVNTNLRGANFSNAILKNTLLHCVRLSDNALTEKQKSDAKLRGANLVLNTGKLEESDLDIFNRLQTYHSSLPFPSEEEYDTCPFIWQIPDRENITIDDLIKLGNYSIHTRHKITDINDFEYPDYSSDEEQNRRYNILLAILRDELIDTKIYWMAEYADSSSNSPMCFDVYLIGKTKTGSFAGIASPDVFWTDYIYEMD